MSLPGVSLDDTIAYILSTFPQAVPLFLENRMACVGCSMAAFDTLRIALKHYDVDAQTFLQALNARIAGMENECNEVSLPSLLVAGRKGVDMSAHYVYLENLHALMGEIAEGTIISRTFYEGDELKAILFGFAPGQELSEHTAAKPAILHFLEGEGRLTLGGEPKRAAPGTWVYMPPNLPHSVVAESRLVMLLYLLEEA